MSVLPSFPVPPKRPVARLPSALTALFLTTLFSFPPGAHRARAAEPLVWIAESIPLARTNLLSCPNFLVEPRRILRDAEGRPILAWVDASNCGSEVMAYWARREGAAWRISALTNAGPALFHPFSPGATPALALSSNGVPYLYYAAANFNSDNPWYLVRAALTRQPAGPGSFVQAIGGGRAPDFTFDADGTASDPPSFVLHTPRTAPLLNGRTPIVNEPIGSGLDGELVFREGPKGQPHILYVSATALRYNAGSPSSDRPVLEVNTGAARMHDLAVARDNSLHVSSVKGSGRFFFGAVGQPAYLHSTDGITWSTNLISPETDVGATAIALDSRGRPGIAFTRGYHALLFTRQTEAGWTPPQLIRTGMGGWDRSRAVRLAFATNDQPLILVPDALTSRLLLFTPDLAGTPTDLAVEFLTPTNRVALTTNLPLTVVAFNRSGRDARDTRLRLELPPSLLVRQVVPSPVVVTGSVYEFDLGVLQGFEHRPVVFTVASRDPLPACLTATLSSSTPDASPADNTLKDCPVEFLPADCLVAESRELILPAAPEGEPYRAVLTTAFCGVPTDFTVVSGELPVGLALSSDGLITGLPVKAGISTVTVQAGIAPGLHVRLAVKLEIREAAPVFTLQPVDQSVPVGGSTVLSVSTRGPASLQWHLDGKPLAGQTGPLLVLEAFSAAQSGRYEVLAQNAVGLTWSEPAIVRLRAVEDIARTLDVKPVGVRPDGTVRLRLATAPGRVYQLERAVDLTAALRGGWQVLQRFVAQRELSEFLDLLAGRPDAAFYRVVETTPPPATPYSLDDATRFVGLAADGEARPGLLPSADAATGRLGPFEFRPAGAGDPGRRGMVLRFPAGADTSGDPGRPVLRATQLELSFPDDSPLQLDERGTNRLVLIFSPPVELPSTPLSVSTLESLLGKPAGAGIQVRLFRGLRARLTRGTFDGTLLRGAQLTWVDPAELPFPVPNTSAELPEFDLDLAGASFRLPLSGEFVLGDHTSRPAVLRVDPSRPAWLEVRPGPALSLAGLVEAKFRGGPIFTVDLAAGPEEFRMALRARGLRLPAGTPVSRLVPAIPTPPASTGAGPARPTVGLLSEPRSPAEYYEQLEEAMEQMAQATDAASYGSTNIDVMPDPNGVDPTQLATPTPGTMPTSTTTPVPSRRFRTRDYRESDPVGRLLGTLPLWRGFVDHHGGWDKISEGERAAVLRAVRFGLQREFETPDESGPPSPVHAFELRARLLEHVLGIFVKAPANHAVLTEASRRAYDSLRRLGDRAPCTGWDPKSLQRAMAALARVGRHAAERPVLPDTAARDLADWSAELLVCRGRQLAADLGIEPGVMAPDANTTLQALHRHEAAAALQQALVLAGAAQAAGLAIPVVSAETYSQLILHLWNQLRSEARNAVQTCDLGVWHFLLPDLADLLAAQGELLRYATGDHRAVDAIMTEARGLMDLRNSFRDCLAVPDEVEVGNVVEETIAAATDETLSPRFLLPTLRSLRRLLLDVPASVEVPIPAIRRNLLSVRRRLEIILRGNFSLWVALNHASVQDIGDVLEAGLLHDQLVVRLDPRDTDIVLTAGRMSRLTQLVREAARYDSSHADLDRAARLLLEAIRIQEVVRVRLPDLAPVTPAPEVAAWRSTLRTELDLTTRTLHERVTSLLQDSQARLLADLLAAADVRLPGGLSIEEAWGDLRFDLVHRRLRGRLGGTLRLPGAGLALTLREARLDSGGALAAEAFGSLQLPPENPVATLRIPAAQPARFSLQDGRFALSGAGSVRLAEGGEFGVALSLADPVYQFSAFATGLRLRVATNVTDTLGLPLWEQLPSGAESAALELLERAGLTIEGGTTAADPDPDADLGTAPAAARPVASDTDELVLATRTLELLLQKPTVFPRPAPAAPAPHAIGGLPASVVAEATALLRDVASSIERATQRVERDATELSELDLALLGLGASVPPAELAVARGPKLVQAAQRLGEFGAAFETTQSVFRQESLRQLASAGSVDLAGLSLAYFRQVAACLGALQTNLIVRSDGPGARWSSGPHWNADAARATQASSLRFLRNLQLAGSDDATLAGPAQRLVCDLGEALLGDVLARYGLDPGTGRIPAVGIAREAYLNLSSPEATTGARELLELEQRSQELDVCTADPRREPALIALVLRARNAITQELAAIDRRSFPHAWDRPEAVLVLATNLLETITVPLRLGLTSYPEPAPRLRPSPGAADTTDPASDLADVIQILGSACAELGRLHDDPASGYRLELARRALAARRLPIPSASTFDYLNASHPGLPDLANVSARIAALAAAEVEALAAATSNSRFIAGFPPRARALVRWIADLAFWLDARPASAHQVTQLGVQPHTATARQQLTTVILPRLTDAASAPDLAWWASGVFALELQRTPSTTWTDGTLASAWKSQTSRAAQALRQQVTRLRERADLLPRFDLALPGDLEVRRLFGEVSFNRETRFLRVDVGGRLEFPNVNTTPGQPASFDLERLRLESNGRFTLDATARTPLPFENASFTGRLHAQGDWPHRALSLSGSGQLTFVTAPTNPDTGAPFPQSVAAAVAYEPIAFQPDGTPLGWRFRLSAEGAFRRSFGPHFAVFGAGAGLTVGRTADGTPIGGVSLGGSVGLIRKSSRLAIEPPSPTDFELVVENAGIEIAGSPGAGGFAAITNGTLRLPQVFYPATIPPDLRCEGAATNTPTGASIAIRSPIRLTYTTGNRPRLDGVLRFSQFGLRLPRAEFLSVVICEADLGLDDDGLPFLDIARAGMQLDLPWDKGLFRLQNLHLGLGGDIRGELFLVEDFDLLNAGGLRVTLPGVGTVGPGGATPVGCTGTALILEDVPGFAAPRVRLTSGVIVRLPASLVSSNAGGSVSGTFCGGLVIEPTDDGPRARAYVEELAFEGDLRLGTSSLALRRARVSAANFDGILNPDPDRPFLLSLAADLEAGPFVFGLTNAQFRYLGPDRLPAFSVETIRFARDATRAIPPPLSFLPFAVDYAALRFKDPVAPVAQLLHPTNLLVTVSGRVGYPTVEKAFLRGALSGIEFQFDADGRPIPPAIDGFELQLSTGAELKLPAFGDLGGRIRIGGLRRALAEGPGHLYGVGEIGGTQAGYRLNLLAAFNVIGPMGLCLDVNLGGAGLILSPTPFQITGASGGMAFLTTENPCDFTQYFVFDTTTGTYQLKQTVELPSLAPGMSWPEFGRALEDLTRRAAEYAARFDAGSIPLPRAESSPLAPHSEPARPRPASVAQLAEVGLHDDVFGCPTNCPPPTVAIVCQPHPDRDRFPNRVIFKLSSLTEEIMTNPPPTGLGLDRAALAALGSNADALGRDVATRVVTHLARVLPSPGAALPAAQAEFLAQQQDAALAGVRTVLGNLAAAALRRTPDAYTALLEVLYEGVPCPDLTLALAGRVSMVGLSSFGWIEGRQVTSLSGSGGVVGQLNVLGVPVGEARVFIATTDANGDPNPSLCGQATSSFGPLDLGRVDLAMRCDGCVTEMLRLFPAVASSLGAPTLRLVLDRVAPDLTTNSPDPAVWIQRLHARPPAEQLPLLLASLGAILNLGPEAIPPNLRDTLATALASTWDRLNPQLVLCGEIQPRLFGFPLTLGGRTAALRFLTDKTGYLGDFSFSPSALAPLFPPGDEAALSFAQRLPDPYAVVLDAFSGRLNDPRERLLYVREKIDYALQNQIVAARYEWHPFGLELGDAAMRVLLPDLVDHPAFPGRAWRNPDDRTAEGLPSRDAVLVQAAASGKLGRAFEWLGSSNDFSAIFDAADPRSDALRSRQLDLRHDYFPHGGVVGGARMALPRLLMVSPETWRPLYEKAVRGRDLFEQLDGALTLLTDFVLRTETNGTAAFYLPAPNPTSLFHADGRPRSADELRAMLVGDPEVFAPDALLRQMRELNASAPATLARLYPDHLAFLRAEMTNLSILGMPVFGTATLTGRPTPMRLLDGAPLARLAVTIPADSAVGRVAGRSFDLAFDLPSTPARALRSWATEVSNELARARSGGTPTALAGLPARGAAIARFPGELAAQLPRFSATTALPSITVMNPRDWAGVPAAGSAARPPFGGAFASALKTPRGTPLLRADLTLSAFSPFFDPGARGDDPVATARREGGLAAAGQLLLLPDSAGRNGSATLSASLTAAGTQPRLQGRLSALRLPTPFPGVTLDGASAEFDNQANPFLRATLSPPSLGFGPLFTLENAAAPGALAATLTLGTRAAFDRTLLPAFGLTLNPVRLRSGLVAGKSIVIHGSSGLTSPIAVSELRWQARASLVASGAGSGLHQPAPDLVLRATLAGRARDIVSLTGLPAVPFSIEAEALNRFTLSLATPPAAPLTISVFPGADLPLLPQRVLQIGPPPGGNLEFMVSSDGTFSLVGQLAAPFNAGAPGLFAVGAEVRIDASGITLSGQVGTASGTLVIGEFDGLLDTRFSGQLTFPRLSLLNGRITLASADGGDLAAAVGPDGTCVSGAVLTLRDFAPGAAPLRYSVPRFCLTAQRGFTDVIPVPLSPAPASAPRALPIGAFQLENLGTLRLSGNLANRTARLAFASQLRLGSLLSIPVSGNLGSEGLRFQSTARTLRLLGLDFDAVNVGATNLTGDLPAVAFLGRVPALPTPFASVDFRGSIPGTGGFSLEPAAALAQSAFLPNFPLASLVPRLSFTEFSYSDAVIADQPAGYWRFETTGTRIEDSRRKAFSPADPARHGTLVGNDLPLQPGAMDASTSRSRLFDGTTTYVRLNHPELAPRLDGFSASVWFRRAGGRSGVGILAAPETLAARGTQWSLRLTGDPVRGTTVQGSVSFQDSTGALVSNLLSGRTRLDDDAWHHVVLTCDGTAQALYLDGRLEAWQALDGMRFAEVAADTTLGARVSGGRATEFFTGLLDEIAVFDSPLAPGDIAAQWNAARRETPTLTLAATLPAGTLPGLPATSLSGLLSPNGDAALQLDAGGTTALGGLRFAGLQGQLWRLGTTGALTVQGPLTLPGLDASPLGTARGVFDTTGSLRVQALRLEDRGALGWDLRLADLAGSGNWLSRQVAVSVAGTLHLPRDLGRLAVDGILDTTRSTYTLRGSATGEFLLGAMPFTFRAAPELDPVSLRIRGRLALGTASDAAAFDTLFEARKSGEVSASFSGLTGWASFPGNVHGQLSWSGLLDWPIGAVPDLRFRGTAALAWPSPPASIEDVPAGRQSFTRRECWSFAGKEICTDVLDRVTDRFDLDSLTVEANGTLTVRPPTAFLNQAGFRFRIP